MGSPSLLAMRPSQPPTSAKSVGVTLTSLPVSIIPQVPALTSIESLSPRCFFQSPCANLSLISLSAVIASGMRSSASATHISSTPSCEPRSYCVRKDCMPALARCRFRTDCTSLRAVVSTRVCMSGESVAVAISGASVWASSARKDERRAANDGIMADPVKT